MASKVRLAARAERDLFELFDVIDAENSAAALKWFLGLEQLIFSLEVHPYRHPTAS